MITCTRCHIPYPENGTPYRCPRCGGLFDVDQPSQLLAQPDSSQPGIWRYRAGFGLVDDAPLISLGEGNTALIELEAFGRRVFVKCEYQNPSGSFKDRGSATLVSFLRSRGVTEVIEDSSGNAGASLAAYAGRAGMRVRIYVPETASGPKRAQIDAYGAEVIAVPGPRSNAAEAVRRAADDGAVYASHAYLPFNLPGYTTLAYEIEEQLGCLPGSVIIPAGQGGLLLGVARGLELMRIARNSIALDNCNAVAMPQLIGVQARACAPLATTAQGVGAQGAETSIPRALSLVLESPTIAEGVRVQNPLRWQAVIRAVIASRGQFIQIPEDQILPARDQLARRGFYVEPTSALAWCALAQLAHSLPDPIVLVLTGSGLKFG